MCINFAPYERLRTASTGADINRQPLTITTYVSTESLRGSGTLHFAQESQQALLHQRQRGTAEPKGLNGNAAGVCTRVGVGGGNSQEIPDESRHKGGTPMPTRARPLLIPAGESRSGGSFAEGFPKLQRISTFKSREAFAAVVSRSFHRHGLLPF